MFSKSLGGIMPETDKFEKQKEIEQNAIVIKEGVSHHFGTITDPRRSHSVIHKLLDIFFMALCAALSGAETVEAIAIYAKEKENWLKEFLKLPGKVPSYNTFWWVFVLIQPAELQNCFVQWAKTIAPLSKGENVAIDGKALRGTADPDIPNSFVHMVSAWASNTNFTIGQLKVEGKSNEITAIPKLLDMIDIKDAVVTIDAMGCQTKIAAKIIDGGGDYILAVKENQPNLYDEIEHYFNNVNDIELELSECKMVESNNTKEKEKHGRIERRKVYATDAIEELLPQKNEWKGLKSIICVHSFRTIKEKTTNEKRYYISSLAPDPGRLGDVIRSHWGIENKVHWMLDVGFLEDKLKAKAGFIAENLAVVRHLSLNLLKSDKTTKYSIANKRLKAALNPDYLPQLLMGLISMASKT
jgi:predicted transposase YbfD/YdcC